MMTDLKELILEESTLVHTKPILELSHLHFDTSAT